MAFLYGIETLRKLCRAVGIDPDVRRVRKLVIAAEVDSVVTAYVQFHPDEAELNAVADVLGADDMAVVECEAVEVNPMTGNVLATPEGS